MIMYITEYISFSQKKKVEEYPPNSDPHKVKSIGLAIIPWISGEVPIILSVARQEFGRTWVRAGTFMNRTGLSTDYLN